MKYHINPKTGKVAGCKATKVRCPFGGDSGQENHFDSKAAADKAAEKALSDKHEFTSMQKNVSVGEPSFAKTLESIKKGFQRSGLPVKSLPSVRSEQELIAKWFNGDRKLYELILRISQPESELTEKTKASVGNFVKRGTAVGFVNSIDELSTANKGDFSTSVSEIDLLDDLPGGKVDLTALDNGTLRAF